MPYSANEILFASYIIFISSFITGLIFICRRIYIMNIDSWLKDEESKIMSKLIRSLRFNNYRDFDNDYINPKILAKVLNNALSMFDKVNIEPLLEFATANNVESGIKQLAKSSKNVERINAARMMCYFPKISKILEVMAKKDKSLTVRIHALISLAKLGYSYDFETWATWLDIFKSKPHALMSGLFANTLLLNEKDLLEVVFSEKTCSQTKSYAFAALAKRNSEMAQEAVRKIFSTMKNNDILIICAFNNIQDIKTLLDYFDEFIGSPNWEIRAVTAKSAARLYSYEILEKLKECSNDSDWRVSRAIQSAISKIEEVTKYPNPQNMRKIRLYGNNEIFGFLPEGSV